MTRNTSSLLIPTTQIADLSNQSHDCWRDINSGSKRFQCSSQQTGKCLQHNILLQILNLTLSPYNFFYKDFSLVSDCKIARTKQTGRKATAAEVEAEKARAAAIEKADKEKEMAEKVCNMSILFIQLSDLIILSGQLLN